MTLEAQNVTFRYPKSHRTTLEGISLSLTTGARVGLLAPSGRGKTTLCRLLAGYERPQQGAVLLDGRPLTEWGLPCPAQLLWQHPEQAVDPLLPLGKTLAEGGAPDPAVLEGLGIRPDWHARYPAELSGGELQRFCVARALGERTRFLLCDEMTAMLDPVSQAQIWRFLLGECRRRSLGLLVVSHSQPLLVGLGVKVLSLSV